MNAVVGERDKALRATVPRNINPALGKSLSIDVDPPAFHQNSAGIPTILSATFTATPNGFVGQVMWSITSGGKLTGTTPNERTLLFSDMTVDTVKVTATIVYDGQAYIAVKTFYKVTDGAPGKDGKDANPEDLSPEALAALLEGQITESQLAHDLNTRIDLVDGPASNPQTVQGRVKAETDARVAAITKEAADRVTYVQQYTYSEQEIDSSLSVFATTVTAQYKAYADAVGGAAVSTSNAFVQSYAYSKATSDSSLSSLASTLRSEFASNSGVSVAYLNNYAYSKADTNSAISSATQTLSTTVGQNTTAIQTQATSINGLSGQYTVKVDNNGYVTGFGLASSIATGTPTSVFIINAGAFSVVAPGVAPQPMFTVGTVAGVTQAVLRGSLFADGSITASKLVVGGSPDNIIPDADISDLTWWGLSGLATAVDYSSANVGWKSRRALHFENRPFIDVLSQNFSIVPGAEYYAEYQSYLSSDFVGNISVYLYLSGYQWNDMGGPSRGYNWGETGLQMDFDGNSPKGFSTWGKAFINGASTIQSRALIRITAQVSAGYAEIGGMSITRRSGTVLIADGAITAQKVSVSQLSALSSTLGTVDVGTNGYVRSGQTGFNSGSGFWIGNDGGTSKLSIGNPNGNRLTYDGANLAVVINPGAAVNVSPSTQYFNFQNNTQYTGAYIGGYTASASNTTGTRFSYSWTISSSYTGLQVSINGDPGSQHVSCTATFKLLDQELDVYLYCTMTDLDSGTSFKGFAIITVNAGG